MSGSIRRWASVETCALAFILIFAALLRCVHLDVLPPFIDESGHIRSVNDITPDFYQIGKVLGQYIFRPVVNASSDPLSAVRLLVGVIGVFTVFGIYLVTKRLARVSALRPRAAGASGLIAASIWAFQPLILFHDRLALHDPLVVAFHVWALLAALYAFARQDLRISVAAGLLCGFAGMVKFPMLALVGSCILLGLAQLPRSQWIASWRVGAVMIASAVPPFAILWPNRDKFLGSIGSFVGSQSPHVSRINLFTENFASLVGWLAGYNTIWFLVLLGIVFCYALSHPTPIRVALAACCALPVLVLTASMTVFFARYLLPFAIPAAVLVGLSLPPLINSLIAPFPTRETAD